MNIKSFFQKNWHHFAVIAIMLILVISYFSPQFSGYGLKQHDIEQFQGAAKEIIDFRKEKKAEPLWTNSMFGGMPATQISVKYQGNYIKSMIDGYLDLLPPPAGQVLLYMLGFYILMMCLNVNVWIGLLGSIAFAFSSYEVIILQAGHNTKALAVAFMAPVLAGFIYAFRKNLWKGVIISALFMAMEISVNHLQVTYYLGIVLVILGIVFLIQAIKEKTIGNFLKSTGGIVVAYILALAINYGNLSMTNDYSKHTIRSKNDLTINPDGSTNINNSTDGLDKDYIVNWSYGIGETFTILSPYVKGYGTIAIGNSPYADELMNLELPKDQIEAVANSSAYWGDQPMTTGPVYIGVVLVFLAFLGMFFLKTPMKWGLLAATIVTIMLSWGKNFMGLTDLFLEYMPGYNKFRAVTIILVIAELLIPILGILFLDLLIKERQNFIDNKKKLAFVVGGFLLFLLGLKFMGLNDGYLTNQERDQLNNVENGVIDQMSSMDPEVLKTQYGIDINNREQINQVIENQKQSLENTYSNLKEVRKDIFHSSMNRSIIFVLLSAGIIFLFISTQISSTIVIAGIGVLAVFDVIPVAYNYLGKQEEGFGYKYWEEKTKTMYPMSTTEADMQILENELAQNPSLKSKIENSLKEAQEEINKYEFTGADKSRVEDAYKFAALKRNTNYRVFDMQGVFNSSQASYFHKSLGGYHGAKLRNIQNVFDFHIRYNNQNVFDMMNIKYFLQPDGAGKIVVRPNPGAMGPAWFASEIIFKDTPNDEIRALGSEFSIKNIGPGKLLVTDKEVTSTKVYGAEHIDYVLKGDTITVPLMNGLMKGLTAYFVSDINGKTNWIPSMALEGDDSNSFLKYVELVVTEQFDPRKQAIISSNDRNKLDKTRFKTNGSVKMMECNSNYLSYKTDSEESQFLVFSEIYYADGWKAYIDGKETEILKTNYLLRGINLPKGTHKVELKFDQPKYHTAKILGSVGSILVFAGLIFVTIRNKRD